MYLNKVFHTQIPLFDFAPPTVSCQFPFSLFFFGFANIVVNPQGLFWDQFPQKIAGLEIHCMSRMQRLKIARSTDGFPHQNVLSRVQLIRANMARFFPKREPRHNRSRAPHTGLGAEKTVGNKQRSNLRLFVNQPLYRSH
jgi:hypothetical protein